MEHGEKLSTRIKELMAERNMTQYRLAKLSGVAPATLNMLLSGKTKDTGIYTILKICRGIGISLEVFFNSDIFSDM